VLNLRPFQVTATERARAAWRRGRRNALVVLPTGTGKTITALSEVVTAAGKGHRVLWLAHRDELVNQPMRALRGLWPSVASSAGIVQAERDASSAQVVFASTATLCGPERLERYLRSGMPRLIVVDEAHHYVPKNSYGRLLGELDARSEAAGLQVPLKLGLTATPDRADRKTLAAYWSLAFFYPLVRAMDEGFLVDATFAREYLPALDLSAVASDGGGDWNAEQAGAAMLKANAVPHTVKIMGERARGRRVLAFTANVEQARQTSEALCADGWIARWVSGDTPTAQRRRLLEAFESGAVNCLVNCNVLTEGTDLPPTDCIVVARPTRSRPLYTQILGRGLRLFPGKNSCLVIDIVGVSEEHRMIVAPVLLAEEREKEKRRRNFKKGSKVEHAAHTAWGIGTVAEVCDEADEAVVEWPISKVRTEGEELRHPLDELVLKSDAEREEHSHWDRKRPPQASWVQVPGLDRTMWAVDCGKQHGIVSVCDVGDGLWTSTLIPMRGPVVPLADGPVPFELARGLGEDIARQANQLTYSKASWRGGPPSESQIALLQQFHVDVGALGCNDAQGFTRGAAADELTAQLAKRQASRRGLAVRLDGKL
jgi:superfamily II DNA or RNA helicase